MGRGIGGRVSAGRVVQVVQVVRWSGLFDFFFEL